eukprot:3420579-Rhodomonas_salina.3
MAVDVFSRSVMRKAKEWKYTTPLPDSGRRVARWCRSSLAAMTGESLSAVHMSISLMVTLLALRACCTLALHDHRGTPRPGPPDHCFPAYFRSTS